MKKKLHTVLIGIFCVLIMQYGMAQRISITEEKFREHKAAGDKLYANEEWYLATQEYLKAAKLKPNDPHVTYLLAESYRKNLDYDDAEIWYKKTVEIPNHGYPYALLYLGLMQKTNGKYIEAEDTIEEFIKHFKPKTTEDKLKLKEAEFEYKGCIFALEQLKKPIKEVNFQILPPPVNSKNQDYAPVLFFHDSSIVFTSSRKGVKGNEKNLATGEARSDNFRYHKVGDKWEKMHNDDNFDIVNTPKDDGAGELTKDKSKYYYTICDNECEIFVSKKVNGKFTKPVKLNKHINAPGYWNAQPTLSPTADTMFFVSKRPGGKGGNDIWMSVNKDITGQKEDWGPAINVAAVNTEYDEISPFWDDHTNTIYFSSNGHVGFGAFDIYVALGRKRDSIVNIGMPFNSSRDDFYFNLGVNKGYLVSDRKNGIGETDIYWFDTHAKESVVGSIAQAQFTDAESITSTGRILLSDTQEPLPGVTVYLKDEKGEVLKQTKTNENGEFLFTDLPAQNTYKITISESDPRVVTKLEYKAKPKTTPTPPVAEATTTPAAEEPKKVAPVPVSAPEQTPPTPLVEAKPKKDDKPIEPSEPAEAASPIAKPKPKPEQPRASSVKAEKSAVVVENFQVKKSSKKPTKALFENIYFDFNEVALSGAGKKAMDELVQYYAQNREIQIEIKAYTDGFGDPEYNKQIAEQRGQACYDYLIGKGVDPTALVIIPVGADNFVGANGSFIGRQLNRRVEFSIIGAKEPYRPTAMAYIVEPRMTLFSTAKRFGMTVNELKAMNAINTEDIKAYSILRVKRGPNDDIIAKETLEALRNGVQEYRFENMQFVPVGTAAPAAATGRTSAAASENTHVVQPSETLFSIAKLYGTSVEELRQLNGLEDNTILVGQRLRIR